ncbi:ATP-binding cassette domain-containing protein, partial [Salmonella enterica subsp. enterica serovar Kentucky]|nr:ATP-binding cassette domain-containing protein [Salmonella enterica subsp. enterica serovar Kentucky]
ELPGNRRASAGFQRDTLWRGDVYTSLTCLSTDDLARFELPETILQKPIAALSGGEKQRIALIRNLQFLPKILLLDEITSALDEHNKRNVNDIIHRYVRDKQVAVLWVTHDKDEIQHADKVITLTPSAGEMQEARYERA